VEDSEFEYNGKDKLSQQHSQDKVCVQILRTQGTYRGINRESATARCFKLKTHRQKYLRGSKFTVRLHGEESNGTEWLTCAINPSKLMSNSKIAPEIRVGMTEGILNNMILGRVLRSLPRQD
jgi:hypothetical protein